MRTTSILLALFVTTAAFAQTSAEYGRYDAGAVSFKFKVPAKFSGSLGLSTGGGMMSTYGGTLAKDRAWFFASGGRIAAVPQFDAKVFANPTDRQSTTVRIGKVPQFFSMHYTNVLSPNAFVTVSASTSKQ